jgi:hypothetical protein
MSDQYHQLVSLAFGHACMTTPYDDFTYILSMERADREAPAGFVAFDLSFHCHITAFMWALEQLLAHFIEDRTESVSTEFRSLPGDQRLDVHPHFARFVPHRIARTGANSIRIQHLADRPIPMHNGAPTSTLLRVLAVILHSPTIIWDGADSCPDWEKVMSMAAKISDAGRWAWDHFRLDRTNPEHWEYVGPSSE